MERFGLAPRGAPDPGRAGSAGRGGEKRNIGAVVRAFSAREVMELYALRQVLEVHAASQIPLPVPQARLAALVAVQREHDAAVADGDARRVFRSNQRFHRELFGLLDNTVLGQAIEEYARRTHPIRFGSLASPGYRERARQEHWAMIHALRDGDRDALMALCRDHLLPSRDAYLASERPGSVFVCCPADTPARNSPSRHGVVEILAIPTGIAAVCA